MIFRTSYKFQTDTITSWKEKNLTNGFLNSFKWQWNLYIT